MSFSCGISNVVALYPSTAKKKQKKNGEGPGFTSASSAPDAYLLKGQLYLHLPLFLVQIAQLHQFNLAVHVFHVELII